MNVNEKIHGFLERLEDEIARKGLTVPDFAKKIDMPKVTVYAWLKGENVMSLENYYKSLEALGLREEIKRARKTT